MENKPKNEMLQLGLILFSITFVVALVLGGVNAITADKIIAINKEKTQQAMERLIEGAEFSEPEKAGDPSGMISELYRATKGGEAAGYCVKVMPTGFGDKIQMLVGIDLNGKITGIDILKMSETPGLGARAADDSFKDQFVGVAADGALEVIKNTEEEGKITALSGATITSKAVADGVNAAADYVAALAG